jgi:hypothetical protein
MLLSRLSRAEGEMMMPNTIFPLPQGSFLGWQPLLAKAERVIRHSSRAKAPVVLTLWANRGGGKTTALQWLAHELSAKPEFHVVGLWDLCPMPLEEISAVVTSDLTEAAPHTRHVILLDNLDRLLLEDADRFTHLEDIVKASLTRGNLTFIATSSVKQLEWPDYVVRERQDMFHIPALSANDLTALADAAGRDASQLTTLTFGYPIAVRWLLDLPELDKPAYWEKIEQHFNATQSAKAAELARVASLLPLFNVAVLRLMFVDEGTASEGLYADYLERLLELATAGLVEWDNDAKCYRFADGVVRCLLANSFEQHHPNAYQRIQDIALRYFQSEARRISDLSYNLLSVLYHLAQIQRVSGSAQPGEACLQWVYDNRSSWNGADWKRVQKAWKSGANDAMLVKELRTLLDKTAYQQITRLLTTVTQPLEVKS